MAGERGVALCTGKAPLQSLAATERGTQTVQAQHRSMERDCWSWKLKQKQRELPV